jgi:3-oxoacyl-[acyl-carrier protein] reductase
LTTRPSPAVDVLVNNASGRLADTFTPARADRLGRTLQPVTAATWTRQFAVDAMGAAFMISEFARRHIARQANWGRIIGLTSGGELGFPGGSLLRSRQGRPGELHNVSRP